MKFFLDENFPKAAEGILEGMGHEVFDLRGSDREGLSDRDIFAEAQRCAAVFLTTDRDFFHTISHLHEKHAGIVMLGTVPCRAGELVGIGINLTRNAR
jgi:predicted nuclease of predicted toxin-antitoxin system